MYGNKIRHRNGADKSSPYTDSSWGFNSFNSLRESLSSIGPPSSNDPFSVDSMRDSLLSPEALSQHNIDQDVTMVDAPYDPVEEVDMQDEPERNEPEQNEPEHLETLKDDIKQDHEIHTDDISLNHDEGPSLSSSSPILALTKHIFSPTRLGVDLAQEVAKKWIHSQMDPYRSNAIISSHPYSLDLPVPTPSWIFQNHNIPYVVSSYMQALFNLSLFSLGTYSVFSGLRTFWRDVDHKMAQYMIQLNNQISRCSRLYVTNGCRPDLRAPALEAECTEWELCMDQDPRGIGRIKVIAETFAEIINSFVDTLSYRTIALVVMILFICLFLTNMGFGFFRAKALLKDRKQGRQSRQDTDYDRHLVENSQNWHNERHNRSFQVVNGNDT